MSKLLVEFFGLVKSVFKMVNGCLRMTKSAILVVKNIKGLLAIYEKYWTLSICDRTYFKRSGIFFLYVTQDPPPLPRVTHGFGSMPASVCASLHLKFPRTEGVDLQNGL